MFIFLKEDVMKRKNGNIKSNSNSKGHPQNFHIFSDFISIPNIALALMLHNLLIKLRIILKKATSLIIINTLKMYADRNNNNINKPHNSPTNLK